MKLSPKRVKEIRSKIRKFILHRIDWALDFSRISGFNLPEKYEDEKPCKYSLAKLLSYGRRDVAGCIVLQETLVLSPSLSTPQVIKLVAAEIKELCKPMTQEEYLQCQGMRCPKCRSKLLTGNDLDFENDCRVSLDCHCDTCDHEWIEEYKLVSYVNKND